MEFLPTPFRHTLEGNFPVLFCGLRLCFEVITFVFPLLTGRPFCSIPDFHLSNKISSSSILSAISTRSSAYSNSQGSPVLNSLESASSTMIKSNGALVNTNLDRKRITHGTVDIRQGHKSLTPARA